MVGQGGISHLAINPVNPNIIYAGTNSTGLFRSIDGGTNWSNINNGVAYLGNGGLAINPVMPTTLFAGVDLGNFYRSTDGGMNWVDTKLAISDHKWTIAIDPTNPAIVYVGTWTSGVHRSVDGGLTWKTIGTGLSYHIIEMVIDPVNPTILYAATSDDGVFRSTDSGTSWSAIDTGLTSKFTRALIINPATPSTLYVGTNGGGLFKSLNSGASWSLVNTGQPSTMGVDVLAIDPITPATLYAAIGIKGLFRSIDGGTTWSAFSDGLPIIPGGFEHIYVLVINPVTPSIIYAGINDRLFRAGDSAPTMTAQPASKRIQSGQRAVLSVVAGGTAPLRYQWYQGSSGDTSNPISGATASSYTTPPLINNASYWVQVSNTIGSASSTTALVVTGPFQVNYDGLSFINFSYTGNTSSQSWEQFKKTFPGTQMELPHGQHRKGPERYFESANYQQIGAGGNCAGFAAVSLIRSLGLAETVEPSLLSPANRAIGLTARLPEGAPGAVTVGQSDVKDYVHLYQARQMSYQYGLWWGQHWSDTPLQTYQAVKSRTLAKEAVAVSIWQAGRGGHRVTAYRTEESGAVGSIYIYDSNWPNDTTRQITIDLSNGQWSYTLWPGETWGGTTDLRYSPASINFPAQLYPGDATAALYAASGQDGTTLEVSGNASLLISNAQGQQLGYQNGSLVATIPGAAPLRADAFNPADPNAPRIEEFFVPTNSVYTVTVQPMSATSTYTLTAFGSGSALSFGNVSAAAGNDDSLVLQNSVLEATFTPATDGTYCQYLTREVNSDNSRDYTACVTGGQDAPVHFKLDPTTNILAFQQAGTHPLTVTLATTQVGSFTGQGIETVQVAPGTVVTGPPVRTQIYLPAVQK